MSRKQTLADKILEFNSNLSYFGELPKGFQVMNPFLDNPETMEIMGKFYHKYYDDFQSRKFIIGINPGRFGAGVTGIPFTDTKRLESECGIKMESASTHEVSSVFVYDMINDFGGPESFYSKFYINSIFPLAIIRNKKGDRWVNANYYDDKELFEMLKDFMIDSMKKHIAMGFDTSEVVVLGKKNADFLNRLNKEARFFDDIKVLEHPRYIQQYKSREKQLYIDKYIKVLSKSL